MTYFDDVRELQERVARLAEAQAKNRIWIAVSNLLMLVLIFLV